MLCGCYGYASVSTSIKTCSFRSIHCSAIHSLKAKTACQMSAENPEGFACLLVNMLSHFFSIPVQAISQL